LPPGALEYKMKAAKKLQPVINKEAVLTSANKLVEERPASSFKFVSLELVSNGEIMSKKLDRENASPAEAIKI